MPDVTPVTPTPKPVSEQKAPATAEPTGTLLGNKTAASPDPAVTQGLALSDGWINSVAQQIGVEPDSLKTLSKFKDVASLAKGYSEAEKLAHKKGLQVPTETTPEADANEFYKALGRPDTVEGYEYTGEKTELYNSMANIAFKNGIPNKAWVELVKEFDTAMASTIGTAVKTADEAAVELKKEWGFTYNKNVEKAQVAMGFISSAVGIDSNEIIRKYGNDTSLIKMLAFFGDKLMEDGTVAPAGDSSIEIDDKISTIRSSDAYKRGDKSAQNQLYALMKKKLERQSG